MLPLSDQRTSSSLGSGVAASRALAASIMPGVQKPHCRPCSCLKAAWMGWSWPSVSSPSTVSTARPSACTARKVQDLMGTPSTSTVQAPQPEVSQPRWVPVSRSSSRRKWASSRRGSPSALRSAPLTLTVLRMRLRTPPVPPGARGHGGGLPQAALGEDANDVALVLDRAAQVGAWRGGLCGELGRLAEHLLRWLGAAQGLLGRGGREVGRPDRGEPDAGLGDTAVVAEGEPHRHRGGGEVADLALELEIGAAGAVPDGHPDLGHQLVRAQRGGERPGEQLARGNGALAAA